MSTAEIDAFDEDGRTKLMNAAASGNVEETKLLLEQGANPWVKDDTFGTSTALDIAKRSSKKSSSPEFEEVVTLLQNQMEKIPKPTKPSPLPDPARSAFKPKPSQNPIDEVKKFFTTASSEDGIKIVDIDIPFISLVRLLIKLGFAAIPAVIVIMITINIINAILSSF